MSTTSASSGAMNTELAAALRDEQAVLSQFVNILQQEQAALTLGDVEQLNALVSDKTRLATRLAACADARHRLLAALHLPADRSGMSQWLARPEVAASELGQTWNTLLSLASQAQTLNATNGILIANRLQHNQQALNALLAASNQAALYGPDGQTHTQGKGRSLGSA